MTTAIDTTSNKTIDIHSIVQDSSINLWTHLTNQYSNTNSNNYNSTTQINNTIILCGNNTNHDKQTLLSNINGYNNNNTHHNNNDNSNIVSYSFIQLNNRQQQHINVWSVDNIQHFNTLLPTIIDNLTHQQQHKLLFMLCVDLSAPYSVQSATEQWLQAVKDTQDNIQSNTSTVVSTCIVCFNTDILCEQLGLQPDQSDQKFDYLLKYMRKAALNYNATLLYTAVNKNNVNIDILNQYINNTFYNNNNSNNTNIQQQQAVFVGNDTSYNIYIPYGVDSINLINTTYTGADSYLDNAAWHIVFPDTTNNKQNNEQQSLNTSIQQQQDSIKPLDNQAFYKNLKYQIDNLIATGTTMNISVSSPLQSTGSRSARQSINKLTLPNSPLQTNSINSSRTHSPTTTTTANSTTTGNSPSSSSNNTKTPIATTNTITKRGTLNASDRHNAKSFFQNLLSKNKQNDNNVNTTKDDNKVREKLENTINKINDKQ